MRVLLLVPKLDLDWFLDEHWGFPEAPTTRGVIVFVCSSAKLGVLTIKFGNVWNNTL
jgi:hypothetical protein